MHGLQQSSEQRALHLTMCVGSEQRLRTQDQVAIWHLVPLRLARLELVLLAPRGQNRVPLLGHLATTMRCQHAVRNGRTPHTENHSATLSMLILSRCP